MARPNPRPGTMMDNRAQVASVGAPAPAALDLASVMNGDNVVDGVSPEYSTAEIISASPDVAPTQPTPEGQPAPAPAASEPPAPTPAPVPVESEDKFAKMTREDLLKAARNQESLIGRHADEVGTYRKLFDKMQMGAQPAAPTAAPTPDPVAKFIKPRLSEEEKQELIALALTDPEKHEEITYQRMRTRMEAEQRQRQIMETAAKVQDTLNDPAFKDYERTLPRSLIQAAMHDPNTLNWVVSQFQGRSTAPVSAPQPSAAAPAPATPAPHRTVKLGNAGGAPATGGAPAAASAPIFSRMEIAEMQLKRPDEYARRQSEIIRAYQEGRVK